MARKLSTGYKSQTFFHDGDGKIAIQTLTDVTAIIESAQMLSNEGLHKNSLGDKHIARIPLALLNAWAEKNGYTYQQVMSDNALMDKFLIDPDNSLCRVYKGAI